MILAEIGNATVIISSGVSALCAVGCFILMWVGMYRKTDAQVGPQPFMIEMAKRFTERHDFDKHVESNDGTHRDLFSKIGGVDRGIGAKLTQEVGAVHERVNALEKSAGGLERGQEMMQSQLETMQRQLNEIPDRIIATLKNTGAI